MTFRFGSLRTRFSFYIILFVTLAILGSLISAYLFSRQALMRLSFEKLSIVSGLQEKVLEDWLASARKDALLLESLPHLRSGMADYLEGRISVDSLRSIFSALREKMSSIKDIYLISSPGGRIAVCTNPEEEVIYMNRSEVYLKGLEGFSVKSIYPWPLDQEPTITISLPFESGGGKKAVLAMNLDLSSLDQVVNVEKTLAKTGSIYLVDRHNVLVSSFQYGKREFPRGISSYGIENALAGSSGLGSYVDAEGTQVIGSWRWLPELELALLVEMQEGEALSVVTALGWAVIGVGSVLLLLSFLITVSIASSLTQPLAILTAAAVRASEGDLGAIVPVIGDDEIARLGSTFTLMLRKLESLFGELRGEKQFADKLIDSLPGIFYLYDSELKLRRWNKNHETALGYSAAELEGKFIGEWHVDPLVGDATVAGLRRLLTEGGDSVPLEASLLHKDGRKIPFILTAVRLETPTGPMIAGVGMDLVERQRLEEQLRQSQKMESVGRLAGGIAHDFNNILTAIIGNLDLCRLEMGESDPLLAYVDNANLAANSAANLIRQLLSFSRKSLIDPRSVQVDQVIKGMQGMLARLLGEKVTLRISDGGGTWPAIIDSAQLDQIIINLSVNARDAMPEGGVLSISTGNSRISEDKARQSTGPLPGEYILLEVSDTGTGMDAAVLDHLFEPFFTTKEKGRGTGLGLATVFGAINQNRGGIEVESTPGLGTSFRVYLPRSHQAAVPVESVKHGRQGGNETILLAEDDSAIRDIAEANLRSLGYTVIACPDGQSALQAAGTLASLDILVTDLIMPGLNGKELAQALCLTRPGLKVLFVSGYTAEIIGKHGILEEDAHFLPKPYSPGELASRVRSILDAHPTLESHSRS